MKKVKKLLFLIIVVILIAFGFQVKSGYNLYKNTIAETPIEQAVEEIRNKDNYTVYDNLPQNYVNAVISVEDRRFFKHNGFDVLGTCRALINDIKAKELSEGGSTITQQLAKNIYFEQDKRLDRKIAEIFMAIEIEKHYSKNEILELYANSIYFGNGYYCIFDASKGYYNKRPADLSLEECAMLAGIPNAPSVYSQDIELAKERQNTVLKCMKECGYN